MTSTDDPLILLGELIDVPVGFNLNILIPPAEEASTLTVLSGSPAAALVDYFPLMKYAIIAWWPHFILMSSSIRHIPNWAPFSQFKRNASKVKLAVDKMMNVPFERIKNGMVSSNQSLIASDFDIT